MAALSTVPGANPSDDPPRAFRVLDHYLLLNRRNFRGTVFSAFLSPLLYLVAMGYGLGMLVDAGDTASLGGVPYVQFIAPGLIVATAMQIGVFDTAWPVLGAIKWSRQYHAMLASPVRTVDIVTGAIGGVALRALLSGTVFLLVAAALGAIPSWTGVLALLAVLLVTVAYAAPMFAVSARAETDTAFTLIARLVVIPMFLFSGAFFPVDQLPDFLMPLVQLVPLYHATELARDAALGTLSWGADLVHVAYLLLWAVVGGWLAVRSLTRRMVM